VKSPSLRTRKLVETPWPGHWALEASRPPGSTRAYGRHHQHPDLLRVLLHQVVKLLFLSTKNEEFTQQKLDFTAKLVVEPTKNGFKQPKKWEFKG